MMGTERIAAAAAVCYFFIQRLLICAIHNNTAKSVPIALRESVTCGYEMNIEYLRKNGKRLHRENMGK
jgi:hypothetical protein